MLPIDHACALSIGQTMWQSSSNSLIEKLIRTLNKLGVDLIDPKTSRTPSFGFIECCSPSSHSLVWNFALQFGLLRGCAPHHYWRKMKKNRWRWCYPPSASYKMMGQVPKRLFRFARKKDGDCSQV